MQLNDLDLHNWRQYQNDITTDALWLTPHSTRPKFFMPKRELFNLIPKQDKVYHGLFIPEIPYQFITRFTKARETVWDCFAGIGTTHYVADFLNRKCICNDLTSQKDFIIQADSRTFNPGTNVQLLIMHPPYWQAVHFSDKLEDGSNQPTLESYLAWFKEIVENTIQYLDVGRFLVLVAGNIYYESEEVTLGYYLKEIIRAYGFKLKSHIIKDYGETKSGNFGKAYNLNYYRQLRGNYNNFYGDNIFLLQKVK
jgi:DNA modification methylase